MTTDSQNAPASGGFLGDPGFPRARRLEGKVAIVTGAGSRPAVVPDPLVGNGKATAILFARAGARVALLDNQRAWAEETLGVIQREGGEAMVVEANVADEASCHAAVAQVVAAYGGVQVLVNNVGISGPAGNATEVDPLAWDEAMRVNVASMMLMSRFAIPHMVAAGSGSIINLSSAAGILGGHPSLLYPTSKAAAIGLTRSMAAHHGQQGVRVNCIAPGLVYSPMVASRRMTAELRDRRRQGSLLKTEGTSWDVAYAALFLASDESRWITGIVLPVDAGHTASILEEMSPRSDASWATPTPA